MSDLFVYVIAGIVTLPIPFLILFYLCARKMSRYKLKALHRTANYTAPVFILAVHVLLIVLFDRSFLSVIIILLLLLFAASIIAQYKWKEEVRFLRAWRSLWRVSFLLFMVLYMGLSLFGLVDRLFFS
ncbi:DUF3397 domain-containing protein [Halobacillus sp. KGW1]|uniref:DUF3397 domain-containing protein n=1 Tax=Halobacillus sp. KGW1 TaxID=1793726 RepID=UPI0007850426|nr:DUF3397 domain-containing protein [Halobacillus sp. KGW1]